MAYIEGTTVGKPKKPSVPKKEPALPKIINSRGQITKSPKQKTNADEGKASFWDKLWGDFFRPTSRLRENANTILEDIKNSTDSKTEEKPTSTPSPSVSYNPYNDYYAKQQEALKAAMAAAKTNAGEVKENTIARAYQEYLKATNAYGVAAENLGGIGLSRNGGYGQRMATNNFNAYQNYSVNANNAHAAALTEIDLAKSAGEADLALKGYQMAQQDKMNDMQYNQGMASYKQTLMSTASVIAGTLAKWDGNKISNANEIIKSIKKDYPVLSESEISAIIASITK